MIRKYLKLTTLCIISTSLSYCSSDDSSDSSNPSEVTNSGTTISEPETEPETDPSAELETDPDTGMEVEPIDPIDEEEPTEEITPETFAMLNRNLAPGENFDLSNWNIGIPIEESDGTSTDFTTTDLINGYEHSTFFFTGDDGAMVFKNFISGPKTSKDTKFTRSELREMIYGTRYDNEDGLSTKDLANNWVFSPSDSDIKEKAGAVDGELTATVKIDHVTTTGNDKEVGRVVIGQIHASKDEPCRLYYQKLPNNSTGAIYFAHEPITGDEQWHALIGKRDGTVTTDGIGLGELFSYSILVEGNDLTVTISREGKSDVSKTIDMSDSGFDNDWMYFKAGVYTQNISGNANDYDQVSFYELEVTH